MCLFTFVLFRDRILPLELENADMNEIASTTMFPLHRCKTLHLVRHAQGIHNIEGEKDYKAYLSPALFDAHLTDLGWQQVCNLRRHVTKCGLKKRIELVVTSPLMRTMQTAAGVFGGEDCINGMDAPLMVANAGNSSHMAISSLNSPPVMAVEACREHLGVHPCDKRRSISEYQVLFPAIDFSLVESNEDVLWCPDIREANEQVAARGMQFINWLWTRKEREIAIVSHSGFLYHTLNQFGKDASIKTELGKHFANCELRSVVMVDKGLLAANPLSTDFPGQVPRGLDLPSDAVD